MTTEPLNWTAELVNHGIEGATTIKGELTARLVSAKRLSADSLRNNRWERFAFFDGQATAIEAAIAAIDSLEF